MKILVVITTAFTSTGGLTTVMMNYYRAMNKEGLKIDFASTNVPSQSLLDEIHVEGSEYYQLPPRKKIVSYFYRLRRLCKNYDLLHVHGNSSTSVLELMAANWAGVKRRIVHNHTSRSQHPWINLLLHPFFLMSYTKAIACSDAAGEWLFGNKQYQILRNAIKVSCFHYDVSVRQQIRQLLGISDSTFLVGHVGKFMDAKNHPFVIAVFAEIHRLIPNSKLLLVGDGPLRGMVETAVKNLHVEDCVILVGLRSDIPQLLQSFDVFMLPSFYEGMPLSVLEAQAAGLPCFISNCITKDVEIGEDVMSLSLQNTPRIWAKYIIDYSKDHTRRERCIKNCGLLTVAGYNIEKEADELRYAYLHKDYDNLLTLDLACHGTPSNAVFQSYLSKLRTLKKCKISSFEFRRRNGWGYSPSISDRGKLIPIFDIENLYMCAFEKAALFRQSCYICPFAKLPRVGDCSIADFWGIGRHGKPFKHNVLRGVSLVLVNNARGMDAIMKLENVFREERTLEESLVENPNIIHPSPLHPQRNEIIQSFLNPHKSLKDISKEYHLLDNSLKGRIKKYASKYHLFDFAKIVYDKYRTL